MLATLAIQIGVSVASKGFMRAYLAAGVLVGSVGLSVALFCSLRVYSAAYRTSVFLYEGIALFGALALLNTVRLRGLPSRRSFASIQVIGGISFAFGIRAAEPALVLLKSPDWRLLLAWDQAFSVAICAMIGMALPYTIYLSAPLPKSLLLKIIGFGATSAANAGALDYFIAHKAICHLCDFVSLGALLVWFIAAIADRESRPTAPDAPELGLHGSREGNARIS
jgi:hypothetical protein